ncbi:MAG: thiamine phosphate synthase [Clostridia bacterium]|nr:thiamine phosphate synthase [Clostridia bacterium]
MSDIICVTNRKLCRDDFFERLEKIAACRPAGIILREKDLSPEEYLALAKRAIEICNKNSVPCVLHSFTEVALSLRAEALHLPLGLLEKMTPFQKKNFRVIGASCHSVSDALRAQELGCTYITAGHIFETDCKRGLPGRGTDFLSEVCSAVSIPVFAIGGIKKENVGLVRNAGAAGICLMSSLMLCSDVRKLMNETEEER